jgi:hypothetical protein
MRGDTSAQFDLGLNRRSGAGAVTLPVRVLCREGVTYRVCQLDAVARARTAARLPPAVNKFSL